MRAYDVNLSNSVALDTHTHTLHSLCVSVKEANEDKNERKYMLFKNVL